ncbi:MAG: L-serine ammonia-lyase [Gammaproteobacteria bacterium CG11_big_fil_rev_8_21_14_0_20_46_22]|nr:MAG: L-serine ammonia-lyase [Gammaproteobacteria bacterium CG12_big_fil_rev_8_21_14_0_65_46_12]PIR11722.1 MAG: L-serine ammonia-lyase [Gammaproteobacteria bacterium CG11_big_fil_rev_8_21_14_0_20_46_22]
MISIFEMFTIGVGPSSSHTVGPMRAAYRFINSVKNLAAVHALKVEIFGSLAHTGVGHGTDKAIIMGLLGEQPETIDPDSINACFETLKHDKTLLLNGKHSIDFDFDKEFIFNLVDRLPYHTNGMRFTAFDEKGHTLQTDCYYSIGGGFVVHESETLEDNLVAPSEVPYPFNSADELFVQCNQHTLTIAEVMYQNEVALRSESEVREGILAIAEAMRRSVEKGLKTRGTLPGGLEVKRRAPHLYDKLSEHDKPANYKDIESLDWLSMFAIAVNEENAAGSRVVTAPTNGAAGVIPAVLYYYETFYPNVTEQKSIDFLLTSAAIAALYKKGASISAAEVGCQGEVGVATSMAAGALTAVLGGDLLQVENAAEIAMEHSLGLTCDPIAGLVQIPCIERNAVGATKAVNISRLAMMETGRDKKVSLDKVIDTMKRTGKDMTDMYKETSKGGLAKIRVNVIEC